MTVMQLRLPFLALCTEISMISLIINTCAGRQWGRKEDPMRIAHTVAHSGQFYSQRAYALQNFILPAAIADPDLDEVIVVGEWHDGEGYTYVPKPSIHFSSDDAPHQRQAGFEAAKGDWLIFQHDDHMLESAHFTTYEDAEADVLIPQRWTRLRNVAGERLPNGEPSPPGGERTSPTSVDFHGGYISGHLAIYRREVLEACPWSEVPAERCWDVRHTEQIRAANFNIHWSDTLRVWDVEMGSKPWE